MILISHGCHTTRKQIFPWLLIWKWFCKQRHVLPKIIHKVWEKTQSSRSLCSWTPWISVVLLKSIGKTWWSDRDQKGDNFSSIWGRVSLFMFLIITGWGRNVPSCKYSIFWLAYVLENLAPNILFQREMGRLQVICNPRFRKKWIMVMSNKKIIMAKVWQRWVAQLFKNLRYHKYSRENPWHKSDQNTLSQSSAGEKKGLLEGEIKIRTSTNRTM